MTLLLRLLPLLLLVLGCRPTFECDAETPCGFGDVCIEGVCMEAVCSTSAQCPIEHYCTAQRQCEPGCLEETDCMPGDTCDPEGRTCLPEPCTDTILDCGFKEFCDPASGECYEAGGDYCRPCRAQTAETDCGEGNRCWFNYCAVRCDGDRECPQGFECAAFTEEGNVVGRWCITYCWLYDDALIGQPVAPPRLEGPLPLAPTCPSPEALLGVPEGA